MSENDNLQPQPQTQSTNEEQHTQPAASTSFCKYCGSPIQKGSAFCPSCGKRLIQASAQQSQSQQAQQQSQSQQAQQQPYHQQQYQQQSYQQAYQQQPYQQQSYQQAYQQQPYQQPYQQQQKVGLKMTDVAKYHFLSAAKWMNIIATLASIMMLVILLFSFFMLSKGVPFSIVLPYYIVIAIYVYPILKTFNFNNHAKSAVATDDSNELSESMSNLRGLSIFMGILTIIGFVAFVVFVIITIDTVSTLSHMRHHASSFF